MSSPSITDSHCHLDFADFNENLKEAVENARRSGVNRMVTICTRLKDEPNVRRIAEKFESVLYAAGTHPMNAHKEPMINFSDLLKLSKHPKFVVIGETKSLVVPFLNFIFQEIVPFSSSRLTLTLCPIGAKSA